jgi:hypothetical protein
MKKFLAMAVVAVMVLALAVSASAQLSVDRVWPNFNDRLQGEAEYGSDPFAGWDIEMEVGDHLYMIGWCMGDAGDAPLDRMVWTLDGEEMECSEVYRAREFALFRDADLSVHPEWASLKEMFQGYTDDQINAAGFGFDSAADGGMMELLGADQLGNGTYSVTIKGILTDGKEVTNDTYDFDLIVGTGVPDEEETTEEEEVTTEEEEVTTEEEEVTTEEEEVTTEEEEVTTEEEEVTTEEEEVTTEEEEGTTEAEETERELAEIEDGILNIVIGGGVEKVEAKAGEEVDVKIELKGVTTLSSLKITLTYDESLSVALKGNGKEKVSFEMQVQYPEDATVMSAANNYPDDHKLILNWQALDDEINTDSVFATITFIVAEDAEAGEFLPITAEVNANDVFNYDHDNDDDMVNVEFNLVNGGIDVIGEEEETSEEEESSEEESSEEESS